MSLEPGQSFSHYRLIEKIGGGGMGIVFKALDTQLNRHVAVKVLPPELTADPERRMRLQREAQAAAALQHPNIAVIHEVGEHEGSPYLVMELVSGKTLRDLIGNRPLPLRDWFRLAIPIADGLAHAHQHGIVHRDLKPDNIMVTADRQLKILDFGLAKLLEPESLKADEAKNLHTRMETISKELTRAGKVFGTVTYMSPEQARGEAVDHRSDLFSFGVLLYQMAAGKRPFKGDTDIETLHAIIKTDPPPLSQISGEIPFEAERVVRKAIEKEPERRYQHADEMATDLRNLQRDFESGRVTGPTATVTRPGPVSASRWKRLGGIIGAAAVLLVSGAFLYRTWVSGPEAPMTRTQDPSIGVLGFENLTDPSDAENLNRILMGLVTTDLAETGGLRVVSTSKVLAALEQVPGAGGGRFLVTTASAAALQAGVDVMLVGQLSRLGERLLLTAELVDVLTGNTVGSIKKEAGSSAELFDLAAGIASDVRNRLGGERIEPAETEFDLAEALTSSPEAYRHFTAGETALHQGRWLEADLHLSRAVESDPTFAIAYYRLGIARWWEGSHQQAVDGLRKGLPHAERLPDRWRRVYQALLDTLLNRTDPVYENLVSLVREYPNLPDAHYLLGELTFHSPRHLDWRRSRESFEKALEIDPTFKVSLQHLVTCYVAGKNETAATELLDKLAKADPESPAIGGARIQILVSEGKFQEAARLSEELISRGVQDSWIGLAQTSLKLGDYRRIVQLADRALQGGTSGEPDWIYYFRGLARIQMGEFRRGITDLENSVIYDSAFQATGSLDSNAFARAVDHVWAQGFSGDHQAAIADMRKYIALQGNGPLGFHTLGWNLLQADRLPEAERELERIRNRAEEMVSPVGEIQALMLEAEIHLYKDVYGKANAALGRLSEYRPENRYGDRELWIRARLQTATGNLPGAITTYREILLPSGDWLGIDLLHTRIRYELARLEGETGDIANAQKHYREFLDRWGEADVEIPEVNDAKSRLANL